MSADREFGNVPSFVNPGEAGIPDSYRNAGLYSKEEIATAKYSKYSRFGRVLDPYGRLNNTTEYVFFTKPDLHLVNPNSSAMEFNSQLDGNGYLYDLVRLYPEVVRELQSSAPGNGVDPFSHLLSFCVNSSIEVPSIESSSMDTPQTMFGTSIEYMGNAESSDEKNQFSLEFVDSKELELYHFFKGYQEYHIERKSGRVYPPNMNYIYDRRLHNVMGAYKFLVDEDMETLIYWAYFWGVFPTSAPREAFSDPAFPDGLTYSVNFKYQFMEDMNPIILQEFNIKMSKVANGKQILPVSYRTADGTYFGVDGKLPSAAIIYETNYQYDKGSSDSIVMKIPKDIGTFAGRYGRTKYKLKWLA